MQESKSSVHIFPFYPTPVTHRSTGNDKTYKIINDIDIPMVKAT